MRHQTISSEVCGRAEGSLLEAADVVVWEAQPSPLRLVRIAGDGIAALGHSRAAWLDERGPGQVVMPPEDAARLEEICVAVAADGRTRRLEHRVHRARQELDAWFRTTVKAASGGRIALVIGTSVEIGEYKDAEATSREVESRLRLVLEHAPVILWSATSDGRITLSEGRGLAAIGLRPGELAGMSVIDFCRSEADAEEILRRAFAGEIVTGTTRFKDRYYEIFVAPIHDASGAIMSIVGVSLDTTDSHRAEHARHESEARLHTILNNAPMILWAVDNSGRVTFSEGKGLEVLGVKPGQLVGSDAFSFNPNDAMIWLRRAMAGEPFGGETYYAEGPFWYETRCEPLRDPDGHPAGALALSIDVTARKRTEQERDRLLAEEREARRAEEVALRRYAFVAEASRVLASSLDQETTLAALSRLVVPTIADGCVVDLNELGGIKRFPVVAYRDPSREPELAALAERAGHGPGTPAHEILATGKPIWIPNVDPSFFARSFDEAAQESIFRAVGITSIVCVPMTARGRHLGVLSFFTVSESGRHLGKDDLDLATDLAVHAALAVDNARLYSEQTLAVQRRDEFLSVASHELRTPVTSLQLAVQALLRLRERAAKSGPTALPAGVLETAERQSKRLARLVENLLDVSRIAVGQLTLELDRVDIAEVVRETASSLQAELAQAGCTLDVSAARPIVGCWDRVRLEQIVTNLLSNALKYGAGKPVKISVDSDGKQARLRVEDRGIGIARDRQASIFDRFERAVSARHYSGFGLGLYIVKQIVTALGGTIDVQSALGAGAVFTVTLPLRGPR